MERALATAGGLVCGYLLDRLLGDPRRGHPVAGFGRMVSVVERHIYRDSRWSGTVFACATAGSATALALGAQRLCDGPASRFALTGLATWMVLGGASLTRVGEQVADALSAADTAGARSLVPSLCGRDPDSLDDAGICRAAVESLAENTSDAAVAPLIWGAVAGVPGLVGYRAVNTLDAMVGYRSPRYRRFGWASARADDIANLVPARIAGALTVLVGGAPRRTVRTWRRDARAHPSPNAGVVESAFAGALGVRLGGRTVYPHAVEDRPTLGDGDPPTTTDLRATVALSRRVQAASVAVAVGVLLSRRIGD